MRGARLMLAVSLLVGSVSLASAEGAWVLWKKELEGMDWEAVAAFESRKGCMNNGETYVARFARLLAEARKLDKEKGRLPSSVSVEKHPGGFTVQLFLEGIPLPLPWAEFVCFPDTIDPREKKE